MSDAQKLIAETMRAHRSFYVHGNDHDSCTGCKWKGCGDGEHDAHVAAEIDKALGGLTRETVREQVPYGDSTSGVMPTAWKKPRVRTRWVSVGWSEVQS